MRQRQAVTTQCLLLNARYGWVAEKKTPRIASRRLYWPVFLMPAELAVGFGLEARPACDWIHPGRWQAVAVWAHAPVRFPRSPAPGIRLTSRRWSPKTPPATCDSVETVLGLSTHSVTIDRNFLPARIVCVHLLGLASCPGSSVGRAAD